MYDLLTLSESGITVDDAKRVYLNDCKGRGLRLATLEFYNGYLSMLPPEANIEELNTPMISRILADMFDAGKSGYNVHGAYRTFKAFGNWLLFNDILPLNPLAKLRPPKFDRTIKTPPLNEDVSALLEACRSAQDDNSLRDTAIVLFMLDTGCRVGEVASATREAKTGTVILTGCKGRRDRFAYLSSETVLAILRYLKARRDDRPDLFLGRYEQPITTNAIKCMVKRRTKEAGIHISAHDLRRAAATHWVEQGANLEIVRQLLGHSSLIITQAYLGVNPVILKREHDRISYVTGHTIRKRPAPRGKGG